jgi:hypothetical protein
MWLPPEDFSYTPTGMINKPSTFTYLTQAEFDRLLTELDWSEDEFIDYLGVTDRSLRLWRHRGYPRYVTIVLRLLVALQKANLKEFTT